MDKRRSRPGWPFWFAMAAMLLPVLYVASRGPALMIARTRVFVVSGPSPTVPGKPVGLDAELVENVDSWWRTVYAPLEGAADRPWGDPLNWYWDFF